MADNRLLDWDKNLPPDLIPAVTYIRETFSEAGLKCHRVTRPLCYAALHPDDADAIRVVKKYRRSLKCLETIIGETAALTFRDLLKQNKAPATLQGFFQMYEAALGTQIRPAFDGLLKIGLAHARRIEGPPIEWVERQTKSMIELAALQIEGWVKECCDRQVYDPKEDDNELLYWRTWRAPRLLLMEPCLGGPYEAERVWERVDESLTLKVLSRFSDYFVLNLNQIVTKYVGEARVKAAQAAPEQGLGQHDDVDSISDPTWATIDVDVLADARKKLLADYKRRTGISSHRMIYSAKNSNIHKPQFYSWLKGQLPPDSSTTKNFERFLGENKPPVKR